MENVEDIIIEDESVYGIVPSGPPVDADEIEAAEHAVEVVLMWGGNVLHVAHVAEDGSFVVGEGDDVDYLIGADLLGTSRLALVEGGHVQALTDATTEGDDTIVQRGELRFVVRRVRAGKKIATASDIDRRPFAYVGGALGLAGILLIMTSLVPPSTSALSLQNVDQSSRLVAAMMQPEIFEVEEIELDTSNGAESGERHEGDEGEMGEIDAPETNRRYGVQGPRDNTDQHLAQENAQEMAENAGVLGTLRTLAGSWNTPTSPFGRETALGSDPMNALGALMGDTLGANGGFGGLGPNGTGRGAGGNGLGTIGLDSIGNTLGRGTCRDGENCDYGRSTGHFRNRTSGVPQLRVTGGEVINNGGLSKETIRRVVRRHHNEVKFCYEQGLAQREDLSGRVTTRFLISPTGAVTTAFVQASSVNHAQTEQCISQAVQRWTFPAPDNGGVVSVTYPFMLQSR